MRDSTINPSIAYEACKLANELDKIWTSSDKLLLRELDENPLYRTLNIQRLVFNDKTNKSTFAVDFKQLLIVLSKKVQPCGIDLKTVLFHQVLPLVVEYQHDLQLIFKDSNLIDYERLAQWVILNVDNENAPLVTAH